MREIESAPADSVIMNRLLPDYGSLRAQIKAVCPATQPAKKHWFE